MSATPAHASSATKSVAGEKNGAAPAPLCFIIDDDASVRHFISLVLHGSGIDSEQFADGNGLAAALARRAPDLVFLDIEIQSAEAIACVETLGRGSYRGRVQLMSNRGGAVLAHVKNIGEQLNLQMLPALRKPFETNVLIKLLDELNLGHSPTVAGRVDLDEALASGWIEFWYQPKIDLRKKQLIGAEAYARANHPQHGMLMPGAFIPGASEASLLKLSELALVSSLEAGLTFAKLGANLRMAVNMPVNVLLKLPVGDIVKSRMPKFEKWPGLVIDVAEEQILPDLSLATEFAKMHDALNIKLAIDDFGRGHPSLSRLEALPFAELKLARAFVADCGTDRVNAPLCKTVIDLAHNFGAVVVAIGIEKASDALALISMGCDYGQGFLLGRPMPEERFIALLRQRATPPARLAPETAGVLENQPA